MISLGAPQPPRAGERPFRPYDDLAADIARLRGTWEISHFRGTWWWHGRLDQFSGYLPWYVKWVRAANGTVWPIRDNTEILMRMTYARRKLGVTREDIRRRLEDGIKSVTQHTEVTNTMSTTAASAIIERLDRIEALEQKRARLDSMRAETMDRIRLTVEQLSDHLMADERVRAAAEEFLSDAS